MDTIVIQPHLDGIDHINVHSTAATELGRLLDPLAHVPFFHPDFGDCESVEGAVWWHLTGRQHPHLRTLYGHRARREGRELYGKENDDTHSLSRFYYLCELTNSKIQQNPHLRQLFLESSLPFVSYTLYGKARNKKVVHLPPTKNISTYLMELRREFQRVP